MIATGVIHLHSRFSFDGRCELSEIAAAARRAGWSFVCMTEHRSGFEPQQIERFIDACRSHSNEDLLIVPGFELECDSSTHILGWGLRTLPGQTDPRQAVAAIRAAGAVAVLAHPVYRSRAAAEVVPQLHGIEIWNARRNGPYLPEQAWLRFYAEHRRIDPSLRAMVGLDAHEPTDLVDLCMHVELPRLDEQSLLASISAGRYVCGRGLFMFDSRGRLSLKGRCAATMLMPLAALRQRLQNGKPNKLLDGIAAVGKRLITGRK